jgi:hypothetical protein
MGRARGDTSNRPEAVAAVVTTNTTAQRSAVLLSLR